MILGASNLEMKLCDDDRKARRAVRISDMGNDDTLVYSNILGEDDNAP